MTIPKGIEQWECDLIAPSGAPGLTDAELADRLRKTTWLDAGERNPVCGPMRLLDPALYERVLERLAAGQAHPQGRSYKCNCGWQEGDATGHAMGCNAITAHPQGHALRDAERWRVIEYCLMGDDNEGAPEFATLIAEIAYRHQIDIGILRLPKPTTLQLIDELAEGYKRGDDAARAAIAKESP